MEEKIDKLLKLENLMNALNGKYKGDNNQIKELFQLHNYFLNKKEHGTACTSCRVRVYQNLQFYYNSQGKVLLQNYRDVENQNV